MSDLAAFGGKELKLNDWARLLAAISSYDTEPFSTGATLGTSRIGVEAKLKTLATTGSRADSTHHFFDNLDVQTEGILEVDHRAGHVEIYVRQNFSFTGAFRNKGGSSYANLVVYSVTGTAQVLQAFTGTLLATRGSINLENFVHQGAFYAARKLELHQGGAIKYRPLVCTP